MTVFREAGICLPTSAVTQQVKKPPDTVIRKSPGLQGVSRRVNSPAAPNNSTYNTCNSDPTSE